MDFYVGIHHPADAGKVERAFVSINVIRNRKSAFPVKRWIMDSGAFTTIAKHGGYPEPVSAYADQIRRWAINGELLAAVSQDYMCEPHMLARTGLTIAEHQRLTIERYDALLAEDTGVYIMPVLQGYAPADYVSHIRQYGERLKPVQYGERLKPVRHPGEAQAGKDRPGMWVGVGSVCKRNGKPAAVEEVLLAVSRERPDLRLHGFGVKITALGSGLVRDLLHSADSMAWSFAARMDGRDANDVREAIRFAKRIETMPVQGSLFGSLRAMTDREREIMKRLWDRYDPRPLHDAGFKKGQ